MVVTIRKAGICFIDAKASVYLAVFVSASRKWGFPKGHMIDKETPMECALREFKEEIGIELIPNINCTVGKSRTISDNMIFNMYGNSEKILSKCYKNPLIETKGEITKIEFLTIDQLNRIPTSYPLRYYFNMKVSNNLDDVILRNSICIYNKSGDGIKILTLRSIDGYFTIPHMDHDISFPHNVSQLLMTVGLKWEPTIREKQKSFILFNVLYAIVHVKEDKIQLLESEFDFGSSTSYNGFSWVDKNTSSFDPCINKIIQLLEQKFHTSSRVKIVDSQCN